MTLALFAAERLVDGIYVTSDTAWVAFLAMALVLGLLNAVIRPILVLLSCPLMALTLGLFIFVINAFMLWLAGVIAGWLGIGFVVDGVWAAFLGALVISAVSTVANLFLPD